MRSLFRSGREYFVYFLHQVGNNFPFISGMKKLKRLQALFVAILYTFIQEVQCEEDDGESYFVHGFHGRKRKRKPTKEEIIAVYSVVIGVFFILLFSYIVWWKCCQKSESQIEAMAPPSDKTKY